METGTVLKWEMDGAKSKGFGFLETRTGERVFCHRTAIKDGNSLWPGSLVTFRSEENDGRFKASECLGGVCFDHQFHKACRHASNKCKFSHAEPSMPVELSLDETVAAVAACSSTPPVLVDTVEACQRECARLAASGVVAVDFEGVDLCRDGELLLAQLAAADGPVVLIDVYKLGEAAFAEGGLRELLQSQQVLKLIFDGRSDSDALYHLHKCRLRQVCDIQVLFTLHLDFASTTGKPMTHLSGLDRALGACASIPARDGEALRSLKRACKKLFVPDCGGSYEVWRQRPLHPALVLYACADVQYLHRMRDEWAPLLPDEKMFEITNIRIEKAVGGEGRAKGPKMAERDF